MQTELKVGSIAVTEDGAVVLLLSLDQYSELNSRGQSSKFHSGIVVSSPTQAPGSRWAGLNIRPATHISDLVALARKSGIEFKPYTRSFDELSLQEQNALLLQRLQKLESAAQ
jgi:hypothetical protein